MEKRTGIEKKLDEAGNVTGYWDHDNNCWTSEPQDDTGTDYAEPEARDYSALTKDQLKAELDKRGIEYSQGLTKNDLAELLVTDDEEQDPVTE